MYNIVTKKTIISIYVTFKEQESWNGTVEKTFDAQALLMEEDDVEENEQRGSKEQTPNKVTRARNPRVFEQHGPSRKSTYQDSPSSQPGDESSNGQRNMRSLEDIYDDLDVSSIFALFSF